MPSDPTRATRGAPDWLTPSYKVASPTIDLSEIASMLYGFSLLDQQGRLLLLDTFNNGLAAWFTTQGGAAAPPEITTDSPAFVAPNSVRLNPGVVLNDATQLDRTIVLGVSSRIGLEAAFETLATGGLVYITMLYGTPAADYLAQMRYDPTTAIWSVNTPSGWADILTQTTTLAYVQAKLVADFGASTYLRAVIGEVVVPLTQYWLPTGTSIADGLLTTGFYVYSRGAGTTAVRLGLLAATRDEQP